MSLINQGRRRILQLAAIATPALALGNWSARGARQGVWTADGKLRFFNEPDGIHWASADGTRGGLFLPLGLSFALKPGSVSPDNRSLAYTALDRRTGSNIWTAPIHLRDGKPVAGTPASFFHGGTFDVNPCFSADGCRITYASLEAGTWTSQMRSFPAERSAWQQRSA
jgi:dipeptidyl aminopeptidase/acylaminoacyl peptidase